MQLTQGVSNVASVTVETDDGNSFSEVSDDPSTTNVSDDPTITTLTQTADIEVVKTAAVDDNGDGITGLVTQSTIPSLLKTKET